MQHPSSRRPKAWFNFVWFQLGWWACLLSAASQSDSSGVLIALTLVVIHCARLSTRGHREALAILTAAAVGISVDNVASLLGIIHFPGHISKAPTPLWLMGMWLIFPITLDHSLSWVRRNGLALQILLGFVGFPLSYVAGEIWSVLKFSEPRWMSVLIYGGIWALGFPFLLSVYSKVLGDGPTSAAPDKR